MILSDSAGLDLIMKRYYLADDDEEED